MKYSIGDRKVEIRGQDYFIANNATIIGSVIIENNVSIWYNTVIRGDIGLITIGEDSNVQDGSILHTDLDGKLTIGKGVTIGHMVMLHNCHIGDNSLIGMNAIILSGAKIGKNCIVGAGALVLENKVIPDNSLVIGSPARVVRKLTDDDLEKIRVITLRYIENFKRFNRELKVEK